MIIRLLVIAVLTLGVIAGPAGAEQARAQAPDPDAGLDDTPLGGLDQTGLGEPLDETDVPVVNNPAPPGGAPVTPPAAAPLGGLTVFPPGTVIINVSAPTGSGGNAAPRRRNAGQRRRAAERRRARHRRHVRNRRHQARNRRHVRNRG